MYLQEIITQYETCKVIIFNKEYDLTTKITQWSRLQNQDIKYIDRLKKNGCTIQYFKIMNPDKKSKNKTIGYYYYLYTTKIIESRYRQVLINKLLDKNIKGIGILRDCIQYMWENKNGIKTSKSALNDRESVTLSMMAYYLCNGLEDDCYILDSKDEESIRNKEVASFKDMSDESMGDGNYKTEGVKNGWSYNVASKNNMKRFKKTNQGATNRWKRTNTYRMNNIVSFDNERADKYHWKRQGLINHKKPYNSKWCVVDTDNAFEFNDSKYIISDDLKQYKINRDNKSQMDQILVYEQEDNLFFFDQNIRQIESENIVKMQNK